MRVKLFQDRVTPDDWRGGRKDGDLPRRLAFLEALSEHAQRARPKAT